MFLIGESQARQSFQTLQEQFICRDAWCILSIKQEEN